MSSKYDNLFFERYIRGELSQSERDQFENDLTSSEPLRLELLSAQAYFEAIHAVPEISVSEEFTDRVVREVRARADRRKFSFAGLLKGLFSRESIGVVISMVVLAVLFRSQLTSVVNQFEPSMKSSAPMETFSNDEVSATSAVQESALVDEKQSMSEARSNVVVPVQSAKKMKMDQSSDGMSEGTMSSPQPQILAAAPSVSYQESAKEQEIIAVEESKSIAVQNEAVQNEAVLGSSSGMAMKKSAVPKMERSLSEESIADAVPMEKSVLTKESSRDFPFVQYEATATIGDTIRVTLPAKNLRRFISAWKKSGGSVIDTVVADSSAIVRVVR